VQNIEDITPVIPCNNAITMKSFISPIPIPLCTTIKQITEIRTIKANAIPSEISVALILSLKKKSSKTKKPILPAIPKIIKVFGILNSMWS